MKINKVIHYCWFGRGEKPEIVKKCIQSWKEILIGYEIIEWNEDNFDISSNDYVKEAYEAKKYAFVSDYVRVYALYNYGGIYLDTDVEVNKSFNDLLENDSIWGFEEKNYIATSTIGARKGNELIKAFLDGYNGRQFIKNDGTIDTLTNVAIVSKIIKDLGVELNGKFQKIEGIATIYPQEYFSPYDYINCYMKDNANTYCVHHYYKSWLPIRVRIKTNIKKILATIIGGKNVAKI
ncbi:MAG: capsular polysaccharide synthesis protein, partial [Romboutsia timonensis]|uniref:glycosyltransferase family 32 protein n=1 Tax=Romboutsia timonensis TaxID=1776391 RepID=UPI002A7576ED